MDLTAYTCTCLDYPVIQFCKHLSAIQIHFPEAVEARTIAKPAVAFDEFDDDEVEDSRPDQNIDTHSEGPASDEPNILQLAQTLERMAAHLRYDKPAAPRDLSHLRPLIRDLEVEMASWSFTASLLPPRIPDIPPTAKGWKETQTAMMPSKKNRRKRAGDAAYGAGERSGKKAKDFKGDGDGLRQPKDL